MIATLSSIAAIELDAADPLAAFRQERRVNFPIVTADEFTDFFFALHHHRQRGCLHAAHGGQKETPIA